MAVAWEGMVLSFKQNRLMCNLLAYEIAFNLQIAHEFKRKLLNLKGKCVCVCVST